MEKFFSQKSHRNIQSRALNGISRKIDARRRLSINYSFQLFTGPGNTVCTSVEARPATRPCKCNVIACTQSSRACTLRGNTHAYTRALPASCTSPRGRECIAHYGIMGYFDPPRITESTMRDSIRKSLGCCSFFPPSPRSSFELTEPRALSGSQAAMDWKRDGAKEREKKKERKKERRNEKEEERTRSAVAAREARSDETGTKERHEKSFGSENRGDK